MEERGRKSVSRIVERENYPLVEGAARRGRDRASAHCAGVRRSVRWQRSRSTLPYLSLRGTRCAWFLSAF